jgi:hypothetical protein
VSLTATAGLQPLQLIEALLAGIRPLLPLFAVLLALAVVLGAPLPGRGPGWFARRDPWRGFKYEARRVVLARAGGRCEAASFIAWGRCRQIADQVDHIYPWSKGGATVVSNGQALCAQHNRSKASRTPPWWYVLSLERRRRSYFPDGGDVRVNGSMTDGDRALRRLTG